MPIELDHFLVSPHDQVAAARQLAGLPGVPWEALTVSHARRPG